MRLERSRYDYFGKPTLLDKLFRVAVAGLIFLSLVVTAIMLIQAAKNPERSCSVYNNEPMRNVPARCISYFEGKH